MNDIARAINEKTNNDEERKSLLINALADKFGTKKDNKYAMNSLGELYSKVKTSKPHSKDWYEALNNYDEAAEVYRMVIGDDALDYYNAEIEKERMKPNANEEKLDYEIVNDKSLDAIKDNFTPPGAKSQKKKLKDEIDPNDKDVENFDENFERVTKGIDKTGMSNEELGKLYEEKKIADEMADFQKSLDDYAAKNKKGREDIPATYKR